VPERHAATGLEPVDRLDQAERGDLDEVLHGLAAVAVPGRLASGQRQAVLNDLFPHRPSRGVVGVQGRQCDQGIVDRGQGVVEALGRTG
jgi:hypothetical protein